MGALFLSTRGLPEATCHLGSRPACRNLTTASQYGHPLERPGPYPTASFLFRNHLEWCRGSQEPEGYMLESDKKKGIGSLLLTGSLTVMWSFIPICWQGLGRVDRLQCPELSIPQDLLALGCCPCASFLLPGPFCGHSESPLRGGSSLK